MSSEERSQEVSGTREFTSGAVLCVAGPPGSGKTATGLLLSERLGCPFRDLDSLIEEEAGRSVAGIFSDGGEAEFRRLEFLCLRRALESGPSVLALGGGCLLDDRALDAVCGQGILVTLMASDDVLVNRCRGGSRPLAADEEHLRELLESRREHYLSLPNRIDTDRLTPSEAAQRILALFRYPEDQGNRTADPSR